MNIDEYIQRRQKRIFLFALISGLLILLVFVPIYWVHSPIAALIPFLAGALVLDTSWLLYRQIRA